jgi:hypothetical protein
VYQSAACSPVLLKASTARSTAGGVAPRAQDAKEVEIEDGDGVEADGRGAPQALGQPFRPREALGRGVWGAAEGR